MVKDIAIGLGVLFLILGMSYASKQDQIEEERASTEYAEMVCLFKETSGEFGWPNFKNLVISCN
jgi:hypothetical protein